MEVYVTKFQQFKFSINTKTTYWNQPDVMYNKEHAVYPVLQNIGKEITQKVRPKAVVVFSAHWQAKSDLIQVNNVVENDLIYEFVWPYGILIHHV